MSNRDLFSFFPKLLHFTSQAVKVWVDDGFSDAAVSQFSPDCASRIVVNANAFYKRSFSLKLIAEKFRVGSKHDEPTTLRRYSPRNVGEVKD